MSYLRFLPPQEKLIQSFVPGRYQNKSLITYLCDRFPFYSKENWLDHLGSGRLTINGEKKSPSYLLQNSDLIQNRMPARMEPPVNPNCPLLFEDEDYFIIDKPAPLPIHPSGPYFKNSLSELWKLWNFDFEFRPVHRLDLATCGILVLAKHRQAARHFNRENERGHVLKTYLAHVQGSPQQDHFSNQQAITLSRSEKSHRGPITYQARTDFKVLKRYKDSTLLQARLFSGRSNQIRIHLAQLGLPIINDYLFTQTRRAKKEIALQAWKLSFKTRRKTWIDLESPIRNFCFTSS